MAKKFEFAKIEETLDIAGHIYTVDCNSDKILSGINAFAHDCTELLKNAEAYGDDELMEKSVEKMEHMLNAVLGEGACNEIFALRSRNFADMYDVCNYVCESVAEARNKHTEDETRKRNGKAIETANGTKIAKAAEKLTADDISKLTDTASRLIQCLTTAE